MGEMGEMGEMGPDGREGAPRKGGTVGGRGGDDWLTVSESQKVTLRTLLCSRTSSLLLF